MTTPESARLLEMLRMIGSDARTLEKKLAMIWVRALGQLIGYVRQCI